MADQTLQVRIEGDLKNLQAALAQAKKSIEDFSESSEKSSDKFGIGFNRKIGIIEALNKKLADLKIKIEQATDEKTITRLNQEFNKTSKEIERITNLGKVLKPTFVKPFSDAQGIVLGLENKLKGLRKQIQNATDESSVERLNAEFQQTSVELARINSIGKVTGSTLSNVNAKTGASFNKLGAGIGNANGVAIEFNRIIQDAPFGVIGIGNNIQQLTANFAQLKATSGSTAKALATSLSALISPANLLVLGISLVTAAFTAYQMGAFDSKEETKELKDEQEAYNESLKKTIDGLDSLSSARLSASKSIEEESVKLNALRGTLENEALPRATRIQAINELRQLYPSYLKGLTDEKLLTEGLKTVYDQITNSITKRATALALEDKLVELAKSKLDLNEKLKKDENDFFALQNNLIKAETELKRLEDLRASNKASAGRVKIARDERDAILEIVNTSEQLITTTSEGLKKNTEDITQLGNEYQSVYSDLLGVIGEEEDAINKGNDARKESIELEDDIIKRLELQNALRDESAKKVVTLSTEIVESKKQPEFTDIPIAFTPTIEIPDIDESSKARFLESLKLLGDNVGAILESGIENTLGDFAFAIGDALASGGNIIQAGGAALLGGLGAVLNQLGQLAIGTGIAIAGIKKALMTLNPAVAIGAGVALIALAGFVSSKARSLGGFGGGGGGGSFSSGGGGGFSAGGGGSTFANAQAPSSPAFSSIPVSSDFQSNIIVYGRLDGNDILLSSQRSAQQNKFG